ncbi:MAG: hypothetical protein WD872_02260 [Pirellulaceae bacterium]
MNAEVSWRLENEIGGLRCGPLSAAVRLNELELGLTAITWHDRACDAFRALHIYAPVWGPRPAIGEAYVRGADLVATYKPSAEGEITTQYYWRSRFDPHLNAAAIEVVLSVQTALLDSSPITGLDHAVREGVVLQASALDPEAFQQHAPGHATIQFKSNVSRVCLFVLREPALGLSLATMVHPSDFFDAQLVYTPEYLASSVRTRLFPGRLEKGVIRRARIGGWFLPAENDLAVAVELAKRFIDEPLPLTT